MSKKAYLITRSAVALAAVAVFFWLFLVPPSIESGSGNTYSSCHPVGWNFSDDLDPLVNDSFDVESPDKVEKYVNGAVGYPSADADSAVIRKGIHEACKEARQGRSLVIIVASIFFAVVFLSVPKPKPSSDKEPSSDNGSSGESKSLSGDSSLGDGGPSIGVGSSNGKAKSEPLNDEPKPGTVQA